MTWQPKIGDRVRIVYYRETNWYGLHGVIDRQERNWQEGNLFRVNTGQTGFFHAGWFTASELDPEIFLNACREALQDGGCVT